MFFSANPPVSSETVPAPKSRRWLRVLIAFVVAFDVAAFFQWADGAFQSEFGGHPDEGTHYATAVHVHDAAMHMRDRAKSNGSQHPLAAMRRTPAFDIVQGGWMLVFGTSRIAALLFMAALAAATTALIFCTVRGEIGSWAAVVASLLWLCAPAVRQSYEMILPEQFSAFILTGAMLLCAWLTNEGSLRCTAVAKWIGTAAMVGCGCVLSLAVAAALKITPGDPQAALSFLKEYMTILGTAAAAFALAGMVLRRRSDARMNTTRVAMTALIAGVLFVRWMKTGSPDMRVLIVATPALAMLAVRGAVSLAEIVGSKTAISREFFRRKALWLFLLLLLALPPDLLSPWQKDWQGFGPVARTLVEQSRGAARVLVVSDARGEGMFASEIAMRDHLRQITVERGSETLANPAGSAPRGRPMERFLEDEQLFAHLTSGRIRYIVLDSAVPQEVRAGYHDQIQRVLENNVRSFWPICDSPIIRDGEPMGHPLRIFRVMPSEGAQLQ